MSGKKVVYIIILVLCAGIVAACSKPKTDVDFVKDAITQAAKAAEDKDVAGVMKHISKDFRTDDGGDRNTVKGILVGQLLNEGSISIFIREMDVEVTGDKAAAHLRLVMTRGAPVKSLADVPRDAADAYRFEMIFRKEDGSWRAVTAAWERIGLAGLL
ncbi:MAG: hypothetical protein HZB85_06400 [Deltaproteobacteria bacterium]|nr:hypothetical protein [Deltaproteobacteria bacterium]